MFRNQEMKMVKPYPLPLLEVLQLVITGPEGGAPHATLLDMFTLFNDDDAALKASLFVCKESEGEATREDKERAEAGEAVRTANTRPSGRDAILADLGRK